jgi:hypothetical protein
LLEAQNVSDRTRKALLDATIVINLIQGQATSEDGDNDFPKVVYQDDEVPTPSPFRPTGSITLPSPLLAPLPPPPCPPPIKNSGGRSTAKQLEFHRYWVSQVTVENRRRLKDEQRFECGKAGHTIYGCPTFKYKEHQCRLSMAYL